MSRTLSVSDTILIANVDPVAVYTQVSDPTRMGRWSPENLGAVVRSAADGGADAGGEAAGEAYVGMEFDGRNRRGRVEWTTRCRVTAAEPGETFAFRVRAIGLRTPRLRGAIATWEYRFERTAEGTRVTETWTDDRTRWPDALANAFDKIATGGRTFADFQRSNIRRTLEGLRAALER